MSVTRKWFRYCIGHSMFYKHTKEHENWLWIPRTSVDSSHLYMERTVYLVWVTTLNMYSIDIVTCGKFPLSLASLPVSIPANIAILHTLYAHVRYYYIKITIVTSRYWTLHSTIRNVHFGLIPILWRTYTFLREEAKNVFVNFQMFSINKNYFRKLL